MSFEALRTKVPLAGAELVELTFVRTRFAILTGVPPSAAGLCEKGRECEVGAERRRGQTYHHLDCSWSLSKRVTASVLMFMLVDVFVEIL